MNVLQRKFTGSETQTLQELVRTNDAVLLSFIEALLKEQSVPHLVLDQNMSIMEGSIGILPRRVMVAGGWLERAVRILREAGLDKEVEIAAPSAGHWDHRDD